MNRAPQSFWSIVSQKADLWHNTHFLQKCSFFFPNFNLLTTEQQQGVDLWINLNLAVNLMLLVLFMIHASL